LGVIATLLFLSLRIPGSKPSRELSLLMEPDGTGIWHELVSEFNQRHSPVRVQLIEGPPSTNAREDLYSMSFLSGKSSFDIVYCDVIWIAKFAAAGWLRDLTSHLTQEDRGDFLPVTLQAGSYHGRLYRMPAFIDAGLLYYRKDLDPLPPQTVDELEHKARALQTPGRWGFLWQGKQYEGLVTVYLELLWGYGGDWIDPETRQVLLDSPPALRALTFLKSTIGTISPPGVTSYIEEDTRLLFQTGHAVYLRNWPYVRTLIERSNAPVKGEVGIAPMVHARGGASAATLGGWGFAISKFCSDPAGAWAFVRFITGAARLRRVQERMGQIPSRRSLIPPEFLPILERARMRPPIPEYAQASDILQRWISAALTGRVGCREALRQAARETRLLLKG
jgi:multiple sugar transport system substrate-binding protein